MKAIAIFAWLAPASVMAAGTRLEYTRAPRAESCPSPTVVRASMVSRLGYDPFSDAGARVLRCAIEPDGAGLRARIEIEDAQGRAAGQRVLTSKRADCADLAPALLLVISLAAREAAADAPPSARAPGAGGADGVRSRPRDEAGARADAARPAAEGPAPVDAAPGRPVSSRAPVRAEAARRREEDKRAARPAPEPRPDAGVPVVAPAPPGRPLFDGVSIAAGALGALGALPHPSLGGTASVGVTRGRASLAIELRFDAPTTLTTTAGQARLWAATGWLVPCARVRSFAGCALAGAGFQHGTGQGVTDARSGSSAWFGAGLRAAAGLPLTARTALVFHADLLFVPSRIATRLGTPPIEIWRTPLVSGALGVALTHDFR